VLDVEGPLLLEDYHRAFDSARKIGFFGSTGIDWLTAHPGRVHVAFVDGKHSEAVVRAEGHLLAKQQQPGDLAIFDDVHLDSVGLAVQQLQKCYQFEYLAPLTNRKYAIGVRRG
jgi:prepilin-type processing-associated H-X9-DG protein